MTPVEEGQRKVAVLLVKEAGTANEPWTANSVRTTFFTGPQSVDAFYREATAGAISLTGKLRADGDVFGWFALPPGVEVTCNASGPWVDEANRLAEESVSLAGYDNLVYSVKSPNCGGGGIATTRGAFVFSASGSTFAHELGHQLGLHHARGVTCTGPDGEPAILGPSCTYANYDDIFDVMGSGGLRRFSNWHLMTLGALPRDNLRRVAKSGIYEIHASRSATATETTNLQIPHTISPAGQATDWFDFEIRQIGDPFDSGQSQTKSGVTVRLVGEPVFTAGKMLPTESVTVNGTTGNGSLLLDAHPATAAKADAPIGVGETVELGEATVTVIAAGDGEARVAIRFPGAVDDAPPGPPLGLVGLQDGSAVDLDWGDSEDDLGVVDYLIRRDGVEVGRTVETGFRDVLAPPGVHEYVVVARDLTGHQGAGSRAVVTVSDVVPPGAPGLLSSKQEGGDVLLSWRASADNGAVARYTVLRDGVEVWSGQGLSHRDQSPSVGEHVYAVYAEDGAGNTGPASSTRVTVVDGTAPSAPSDLAAAQLGGDVHLSWSASTDDVGVEHYQVYRDQSPPLSTTGTELTDLGIAPGAHRYSVRAVDALGNISEASQPVEVTVAASTSAPTAVAADGTTAPTTAAKPRLRISQRRGGYRIEAKAAPEDSGAREIGVWVDGKLLLRRNGGAAVASWNPEGRAACRGVHLVLVRVFHGEEGPTEAKRRLRPGATPACRSARTDQRSN